MPHIHDHGTTVVSESDSSSSVLLIVLAVIIGIALLWAIFFSGWVIDRTPETVTNIDRTSEGDTNVDVNNPGGGGTTSEPSPAPTQPAPTTAP